MRKARTSARLLSAHFPPLALLATSLTSSVSVWAQEGATPTPPPSQPSAKPDGTAKPDGETEAERDDKTPSTVGEEGEDAASQTSAEPSPDGTDSGETTAQEGDAAPIDQDFSVLSETGSMSAGGAQFGAFPNPADDEENLKEQGKNRPKEVEPDRVFAEDWWAHTRPTLELHGNFRVRAGIYHNFHLNRYDAPGAALWPRPIDDYYEDTNGETHGVQACTPAETIKGEDNDSPANASEGCRSPTQGGANMRFRLEPTIVISDNLRIRSQIDMLGNLVMGSTPQGDINFPAASGGGYAVRGGSGYGPISASTNTVDSPVSGINSLQDAIKVNRAWAEYETPVGALKFGRMPDHWGLGIMRNAGDDIDGDYQSTVDRIAFITGLPSLSLYAGGAWDFMNEGATSAAFTPEGGEPYDLGQRDDQSRMNLMLFRRMDEQLEQLALKKGKVVVNGGLYLSYQWQRLANDVIGASATCANGADALDCEPGEASAGIVRRGFKMWTPDLYVELKYKKFYTGIEVVTQQGKFDSLATTAGDNDYTNDTGGDDGWRIRTWGLAGEIEQRLVEDRLKLGFYSGWASGDPDRNSLVPTDTFPDQIGDRTLSQFNFHPGYRIDLILHRHLLSRVGGTYYFKPMAQYDFIRKATGMKLGGRAEAIWSRASNFLQTPGHQRDLGIELNATVYYQSKDGVLNDRPDLTGGFFGMMQYGVAFPLGGLGYQDLQIDTATQELKLKPAQMVRGFMGVAF